MSRRGLLALAAAIGGLGLMGASAQADSIKNGGFEVPLYANGTSFVTINQGETVGRF